MPLGLLSPKLRQQHISMLCRLCAHSLIHSISIAPLQDHYNSEALPTTTLILCRSQHIKAPQATASQGLAQGPYVAARSGFDPATLGEQKAPKLPMSHHAPLC